MTCERGKLLYTGKTKEVYEVLGRPDQVILAAKDDITAFDNAKFTKKFATKARSATATTCRVFELLAATGIPVAYVEQISPTEFVSPKVRMIPLEVIARRYAPKRSSYLKRHPELVRPEGFLPHRFHRLVVEFFLKTSKGKLHLPDGKELDLNLSSEKGEEDPFIAQPDMPHWDLFHSKKPAWSEDAKIGFLQDAQDILDLEERIVEMDKLTRSIFLVLEGAWATLGLRLIDFKIEFGVDEKGRLMVADVIDNDSWRLRDLAWQELSKQAFRDGENLGEVEKKYAQVASLVERFRIPYQAIVLWRGSDKDKINSDPELPKVVDCEVVTVSGHKSPSIALSDLETLLTKYPDGGVIIAEVGMSNGLGPILAARTSWPVIAVPLTADEHPEDAWSSLRLPSQVPLPVIMKESNAILAALNILARNNPAVYAYRQLAIEALDD